MKSKLQKPPRMRNYHIKAYSSQVKMWKACAEIAGVPVSKWVRISLNKVAMETISPIYGETEMKRGVKSYDDEFAESFQFRITLWEKSEWAQCSDQEGLTIGEWCRQSLDWVAQFGSVVRYRKVI